MACSPAPHNSILFMKQLSLPGLEFQLKKRWAYPYKWFRKQNNCWDSSTNFIYETEDWEILQAQILATSKKLKIDDNELFNYAINRWYNFWSAIGVEQIFTEIEGIEPAIDFRNRLVDFTLFGIDFDHKTSVFPKYLRNDLVRARSREGHLIEWLYKNQSDQNRLHLSNRLYIVVYDSNGEHWKLKAELGLLKREIQKYAARFSPAQLHSFTFAEDTKTLSDIIWVAR